MTILLYVRRKGWPLESVTVECSHERTHSEDLEDCEEDEGGRIETIRRYILLKGELTEEQRKRIGWIALRCPVHRTLEPSPRIVDEIDVVA